MTRVDDSIWESLDIGEGDDYLVRTDYGHVYAVRIDDEQTLSDVVTALTSSDYATLHCVEGTFVIKSAHVLDIVPVSWYNDETVEEEKKQEKQQRVNPREEKKQHRDNTRRQRREF